jgi:hypothetical protein
MNPGQSEIDAPRRDENGILDAHHPVADEMKIRFHGVVVPIGVTEIAGSELGTCTIHAGQDRTMLPAEGDSRRPRFGLYGRSTEQARHHAAIVANPRPENYVRQGVTGTR